MRILHLSDTHIGRTTSDVSAAADSTSDVSAAADSTSDVSAAADSTGRGDEAADSLRLMLGELRHLVDVDAVVVTGDLADHGTVEEYGTVRELVGEFARPLNAPVFYVPLLFGTYEADLGNPLFAGAEVTDEGRALSDTFRTSWTSFARTGDPGRPTYDPKERLVRILDIEPTTVPYPEETSRRLWERHDFPPLPLLGGKD